MRSAMSNSVYSLLSEATRIGECITLLCPLSPAVLRAVAAQHLFQGKGDEGDADLCRGGEGGVGGGSEGEGEGEGSVVGGLPRARHGCCCPSVRGWDPPPQEHPPTPRARAQTRTVFETMSKCPVFSIAAARRCLIMSCVTSSRTGRGWVCGC